MKKYRLLLLIFGSLAVFYSCTKDKTSPPVIVASCSPSITYTSSVKLILDTYCGTVNAYEAGSCHDASSSSPGPNGTVYLYDYATAKTAFQSQNALCPVEHQCTVYMPNASVVQALGLPDSLDNVPDSLITVLKCWAQNQYPQ